MLVVILEVLDVFIYHAISLCSSEWVNLSSDSIFICVHVHDIYILNTCHTCHNCCSPLYATISCLRFRPATQFIALCASLQGLEAPKIRAYDRPAPSHRMFPCRGRSKMAPKTSRVPCVTSPSVAFKSRRLSDGDRSKRLTSFGATEGRSLVI